MTLPNRKTERVARFRVDPDRSEHPDYDGRSKLAVRVPVVAHLEMPLDLDTARRRGHRVLARRIRNTLEVHIAQRTGYSGILEAVTGDVTAHRAAQQRSTGSASPQTAALLDTLGGLACASCTTRRVCSGRTTDHKIVNDARNQATCLGFILDMFSRLVESAEAFYHVHVGEDALSAAGHPGLSLRLVTLPTLSAQLGAFTQFPSDDAVDNRCADVTVTLPVDVLDQSHLGALPYFLFHEIAVHGPEAWFDPGRRATTSTTCALREGFVDAAAVAHLIDALRQDLAFAAFPNLSLKLADLTRQAHLNRINPNTSAMVPAEAEAEDTRGQVRQWGSATFEAYRAAGLEQTGRKLAAALNLLAASDNARAAYLAIARAAATALAPATRLLGSPEYEAAVRLKRIVARRNVDLAELSDHLSAELVAIDKGF